MSDFRRGMAAFDRGAFEEAAGLLRAHAQRHPRDWRATLWLARAMAESGQPDEAVALLRGIAPGHRGRPVAGAFTALVLMDAQRFDEAEAAAQAASGRTRSRLAEAIGLISAAWRGAPPSSRMTHLIASTTADVAGRALHLAQARGAGLPTEVLRDTLDEVGLGWPGYRLPPPWLLKWGRERAAWRAMAGGRVGEAYDRAAGWADGESAPRHAPTMVTAAVMACKWEEALRWACLIPRYRAFTEGNPPRRPLDHFQLALFRGVCTLMAGDSSASLADLALAAGLDATSYLPRYFMGIASVACGDWQQARREFVAVCQRLNPSVAVVQWKTLVG